MSRPGRFLVLCLLLVLLPLRSVLAASAMGCEPLPQPTHQPPHQPPHQPTSPPADQHEHAPGHEVHDADPLHEGHDLLPDAGSDHHATGKPCKLCAPCCLAAAPPPVMLLDTRPATPAARVAGAAAEAWVGIVPPLPDPPPRG
ncbi:MAG: hypothetical protein K9J82_14535 [Methylotenera sp.]|jgi:hypothetical protein|nr:hypothetical protein [Methylotenera sp.]